MKAKDYADLYRHALASTGDVNEAAKAMASEFFAELPTLVNRRNVQTDSALIAVVRELDQKWRALTRLVTIFNPEGFMAYIKDQFPEIVKAMGSEKLRAKIERATRR